ncbi:MAG: Mov34/MPN/PAD-1 family protein, partial [Chloroflexota bacterium]
GQAQLVQDCTLAQLRAYAEAWEAGVWDAYEAITLGQLAADEQVELSITLADDTGDSSPADWLRYALVLPPAPASETAAVDREAATEVVGEPEVEPEAEPEATPDERVEDEPEETEETKETAASDSDSPALITEIELVAEDTVSDERDNDDDPQVIVSPSEPVYEEKEADPDETALAIPVLGPQPGRIAGQKRPLHDFTWAAVDVFIEEPALRAAQAHALSSPTREVAGVLVGPRPEKQPDGRYRVHISDTIIAKHTVMQGASVTYTPESWRYMNDQLYERYPDETSMMVGWYHTHPGFGIFLSGMDLFIHQNFFTQIWHVALVLDPRARSAGFFGWDRQRARVSRLEFQWPAWAEIW